MDNEKVGLFISKLRKEKQISQEALANELHVDRTLISKWENGKAMPDLKTLKALATLYNIPFEEILKLGDVKKQVKIYKIIGKTAQAILPIALPAERATGLPHSDNPAQVTDLISVRSYQPQHPQLPPADSLPQQHESNTMRRMIQVQLLLPNKLLHMCVFLLSFFTIHHIKDKLFVLHLILYFFIKVIS